MDPPRSATKKGRKKKPGKGRSHRTVRDPLYSGHPPPPPRVDYDSTDSLSFDELTISDVCPGIEDGNEDEEDGEIEDALVKRLYQGPPKCRCCVNWTKKPPQSVVERTATEKTARQAVTARYSTVKKDMQLATPIHSIAVHSQHVKDLLSKVMDGYPGVHIGRKTADFYPPFQPVVHVWDQLQSAIAELDGEAREHANAFHDVVEPEIGETIKDRDDLLKKGLITYDLLWTLYKPGACVFCEINGTRHLMQISSTSDQTNSFFLVNLTYWDLSLQRPVSKHWSEQTEMFAGTRPIVELDAVPSEHFPNVENALKELRLRGLKIKDTPQGGLKWFKGFVTVPNPQGFGGTRKKWIESRIIVDPEEHDKMNTDPYAFPAPDPLMDPLLEPARTLDAGDELSDTQLAQARSVFRGFSLKTKSWHEFEADQVSDVEWNDQAFDQLVMQSRRKRLIKALVDSNQGRDSGFDDFIKGKGQGLVMLLQGPPGTGKTLTAESIAERIHLPLYSVHSSELSAAHVGADIEHKLTEILHRAAHWNAVLLIDEADAFLENRSSWDMERNQRVAIFLRLLEFYSGVLILTTNRPVSFDPAFYSRIHLTLKFEDLDHSARSSVWKNFLRFIPNNVHDGDVSALAEAALNGRQIKNVIKMASLLAHSEADILSKEHLETMLEAVDEIGEDEHAESEAASRADD